MNAPVLERTAGDAVLAASQWIITAQPVIAAVLALEDVESDLMATDDRTREAASAVVLEAMTKLREQLASIRFESIERAKPAGPSRLASDAEWDRYDEVCAALQGVVSVAAAIHAMRNAS